jgi:hypothetical protein
MRYTESTTLFNLDKIDYKALTNKIRNSKKNITINLTRIEPFLKLIQAEYQIVNKMDIPVFFEFTISGGHHPTVMMRFEHIDNKIKNVNMLAHVSNNSRELSFDMSLLDFNKHNLTPEDMFLRLCHRYAGKESHDIVCSLYSKHLLKILKKMDILLNCNENIYRTVYEKGIYVETNKIICDYFDVRISTKEIKIESKAKHKSGYFESLFSINVDTGACIVLDDIKIKFEIYNQTIKLTYEEFMMADVKDIELAIISLVRLKNVTINDMDNLKAELSLHEMIHI